MSYILLSKQQFQFTNYYRARSPVTELFRTLSTKYLWSTQTNVKNIWESNSTKEEAESSNKTGDTMVQLRVFARLTNLLVKARLMSQRVHYLLQMLCSLPTRYADQSLHHLRPAPQMCNLCMAADHWRRMSLHQLQPWHVILQRHCWCKCCNALSAHSV